jgi:hypothetical protein
VCVCVYRICTFPSASADHARGIMASYNHHTLGASCIDEQHLRSDR